MICDLGKNMKDKDRDQFHKLFDNFGQVILQQASKGKTKSELIFSILDKYRYIHHTVSVDDVRKYHNKLMSLSTDELLSEYTTLSLHHETSNTPNQNETIGQKLNSLERKPIDELRKELKDIMWEYFILSINSNDIHNYQSFLKELPHMTYDKIKRDIHEYGHVLEVMKQRDVTCDDDVGTICDNLQKIFKT